MKMHNALIRKAVMALQKAAPGARVILFGSQAKGTAGKHSDADFLVVERRVESRRDEMVRLRDVLRPLGIPADVVVVSEKTFREWRDTPGTVIYEAAKEGKVFEPVA